MTVLKKLTLAALTGTLLVSGLTVGVMANDERGGARQMERGGERGGQFRAGERFARADVDGDRLISLEEFQAGATERFTALDADGDGSVTAAEMVAQRQRMAEDRAQQRIDRIDANEDGVLSLDEMEAAGAERFERMDRNDDGSLEPREMRQAMRGERGDRGDRDGPRGPRGGDAQGTERTL